MPSPAPPDGLPGIQGFAHPDAGALAQWDHLLEAAAPGQHVVQLYGTDNRDLVRRVCQYFRAGLRRGEGVLGIATLEHAFAFARELRADSHYREAVSQGRLLFLDAEFTLAQCMDGEHPSWERFDAAVNVPLSDLARRVEGAGIRAYGEMVGLLWTGHRADAAFRLEQFWNVALRKHNASLFCGYPIDLFEPTAQVDGVLALVGTHTHVVPNRGDRAAALERAIHEVLGESRPAGARNDRDPAAALPRAEALALDLWRRFPDRAREVLRLAASYPS
jgi:DcmR-like sensory protein